MKKLVPMMVRRLLLPLVPLTLCAIGLAAPPDGPYLGQTPPSMTPEVFAPGLVCFENRQEQKIAFSPDGSECLFTTNAGTFYTKQVGGHWTEIGTASFLGSGGVGEPFFSPDGQKLFFIRNADIWVSTRTSGSWATPQRIASPIRTSAEE